MMRFTEDETYSGRIDWALWRRMLLHARLYRRPLAGLAIMGLVAATIDVLFPLVTAWLIDTATRGEAATNLILCGLAYLGLSIGFAVTVWIFIVLAGQVTTGIAYDLRRFGFRRLQELSFSYYDKRPTGWLVTRLTSDCSKLSTLLPWFMLDLFWGVSMVFGIIAAMLWLDWKLALIVASIIIPLTVVTAIFQTKLLESSRLIRRTNSQMTAGFNEAIIGVRTTKALVREERNLEEFQVLSSDMFRYSMRNSLQAAVYLPLVIVIGSLGVGLALWRGGVDLAPLGGDGLTLGGLVAFMQYAALFYLPIQEMARRFTDLQSAQAAAERVQGLLDTEPQIKDAPGAIDGGRIERIEFRDVMFGYKPGEPVLSNFTFNVKAGQTVALVGPTGGGKSTVVSLAARFYEPSAGSILINGVDYRKLELHWLQSNLGTVLQTPHLFSGTIRENIRYGRLDATDQAVEDAARVVNAHDFIVGLDEGYDTQVGEGGGQLSTGQRQLVSLARAVLADPQIFIMDEATSSVDTETERLIQDGIEHVLAGRIAFVIAHRLSTIRTADVIVVLEAGTIVEQGRHDELLERGGRYAQLYRKHFTDEASARMFQQ
jgi:ATP-binding cassette subfamily B protein